MNTETNPNQIKTIVKYIFLSASGFNYCSQTNVQDNYGKAGTQCWMQAFDFRKVSYMRKYGHFAQKMCCLELARIFCEFSAAKIFSQRNVYSILNQVVPVKNMGIHIVIIVHYMGLFFTPFCSNLHF